MHPLIAAHSRLREIINAEPSRGPVSPYYPQWLRLVREARDFIDELLDACDPNPKRICLIDQQTGAVVWRADGARA